MEDLKKWLEYDRDNAKAMTIILQCCIPDQIGPRGLIDNCDHAGQMWKTFKDQYLSQGYNLEGQYINKLARIQYRHFDKVQTYIIGYKSLMNELKELNNICNDSWLIHLFI